MRKPLEICIFVFFSSLSGDIFVYVSMLDLCSLDSKGVSSLHPHLRQRKRDVEVVMLMCLCCSFENSKMKFVNDGWTLSIVVSHTRDVDEDAQIKLENNNPL